MKFRSALLIACLVVVPLLAMVSHKVPAATRIAIRERCWDPLVRTLATTLGLGAPPPTTPFRQPVSVPPSPDAAVDTAEVTLPESSAGFGNARSAFGAVGPTSTDRDAPPTRPAVAAGPETASTAAAPAPPPAILLGAEDSLTIGEQAGRESLEARLRALGATQIDWTPGQGGDGLHRCSCRIPAEPTGQLHRVFQAAAADPVAALDNLVGQVTAWSMRSAGTTAGPAAPLLR